MGASFAEKVAIVTGAAGGLGLAIAERLAADGAAVVVADVSDAGEVAALIARTREQFGRLDILVSNAGIGGTHAFLDEPIEHWNRVLAVNLTGVFLCGQAAARVMVEQRAGRIVNIASISGARAGSGRTAY